MTYVYKNYAFDLRHNEEVLYVPNKDIEEFWILTVSYAILLIPLEWIAFKISGLVVSIFILLLSTPIFVKIYIYIRDYYFSQVFLTNNRLIIIRQNKMISIDYNEIRRIQYREICNLDPTNFKIELYSGMVYIVNFVPKKLFKQKFEEINPDISYKNEIFFSSEIINNYILRSSEKIEKNTNLLIDEEDFDSWIIQPKRVNLLKHLFFNIFFAALFYVLPSRPLILIDYLKYFFTCLFALIAMNLFFKLVILKPVLVVKESNSLFNHSIILFFT